MKEDVSLVIKTGDDIMIEGTDQPQLVATVEDGDSFRMKDEGGAIYIRAASDARLSVPRNARVTIEFAGGEVGLLNLNGNVTVQKVGDDLTFQNLNSISVDSVGGDCFFKEVTGSIEIHRVGGDLDGYNANQVKALAVGGDIELSDISGAVDLKSGGDIHLQLTSAELSESHLQAAGDINLEVAANTKAILNMSSNGESISVKACGQQLDVEERNYTLPLGEGGAAIELNAQGDIKVGEGKESTNEFSFVFNDLGDTWRDFGREIEDKIRQSMKGMNHTLKEAGWQMSDAVQRATEKMHGFDVGKEGKVFGFSFDKPGQPEVKKEKKRVSDEERMMVLKMLQEKKISVEEAEKLLQALEK
jgi:hypothetical protein